MNDQKLDFTIERLGECRFTSPMRGVGSPVMMNESSITTVLERSAAASKGLEAAGPGTGGTAGAHIFRTTKNSLRYRHLRRALPRDQ